MWLGAAGPSGPLGKGKGSLSCDDDDEGHANFQLRGGEEAEAALGLSC